MTVSIAVVCEAETDFVPICQLIDTVLCRAVDWIEPPVLDDYRHYRGFRTDSPDPYMRWQWMKAEAAKIQIQTRFRGEKPRHPFAQLALKAINILAASPDRCDAIVLIADSDADPGVFDGLAQARDYRAAAHLPILVAAPHTKFECWHLSGFVPTVGEQDAFDAVRQELGFDPCTQSHQLTASNDPANDKRSAKRVLAELCGGNRQRELDCLADLDRLRVNGTTNGLADFLDELTTRLVPIVRPA